MGRHEVIGDVKDAAGRGIEEADAGAHRDGGGAVRVVDDHLVRRGHRRLAEDHADRGAVHGVVLVVNHRVAVAEGDVGLRVLRDVGALEVIDVGAAVGFELLRQRVEVRGLEGVLVLEVGRGDVERGAVHRGVAEADHAADFHRAIGQRLVADEVADFRLDGGLEMGTPRVLGDGIDIDDLGDGVPFDRQDGSQAAGGGAGLPELEAVVGGGVSVIEGDAGREAPLGVRSGDAASVGDQLLVVFTAGAEAGDRAAGTEGEVELVGAGAVAGQPEVAGQGRAGEDGGGPGGLRMKAGAAGDQGQGQHQRARTGEERAAHRVWNKLALSAHP